MPQPTATQVHVNRPLTNISIAFIQQAKNFVAARVFPSVPVDKQSDSYFVYTKADWFRDEARKRGDSTESAGSGYDIGTTTYNCDVFAFHKDVGDQVQANSDSPLDPLRDAAVFVIQRMLLRKEIQWATDFMVSGSWDTNKTGTTDFTKWSTYAGSDPITDIETGKATILQNTGYLPNTLVLGYTTFRYLKNHPLLVDRFKHTTPNVLTTELMAGIFDIERVLVCMAVKNTGNENEAASYSFVQTGADALLCYVNPTPSPRAPSAGYCFEWKGVSDGLGETVATRSFNMPQLGKRHQRVESELAFDNKVVASAMGYYFTTAV